MKIHAMISALAIAAAAALPATAADDLMFGQWKVQCAEEGGCQAFVNLAEAATGKLALTVSVHRVEGAPAPTLLLTLPLGAALAPGALIEAGPDKQRLKAQAEVCYPDGCRFAVELQPGDIAALAAAPSFTVRFFAYAQENAQHAAAAPTDGLKEALDYLAGAPSKRER